MLFDLRNSGESLKAVSWSAGNDARKTRALEVEHAGEPAANNESCGEDAAGSGAGAIHDLAVEHAYRE